MRRKWWHPPHPDTAGLLLFVFAFLGFALALVFRVKP